MRHLLHVRRLRQLLGGNTGQRAENLFSLLDGKSHPYPPRIQLPNYFAAARGGDNGGLRLTHKKPPC